MKKKLAVLLAMVFAFPAVAFASGTSPHDGETAPPFYTYRGKFPAGTVISVRIETFPGIGLLTILDAIECMADEAPVDFSPRVGLSADCFLPSEPDGDLIWLDAQHADDYVVEFILPNACEQISIMPREHEKQFVVKDLSLQMPFDQKNAFLGATPLLTPKPLQDYASYSACEQALIQYLEYWKADSVTDMVPLTTYSWRQKASFLNNGAEQALHEQISGSKLHSFVLEGPPTGTDADTARTINLLCDESVMDEHRLYRYIVLMLCENGEWLVDPNSMMSAARVDPDTLKPGSD